MNAKRVGVAVLVLVCLIGIVVFWVHRQRVRRQGGDPMELSFHATRTELQTSLTSTGITSGSDFARLAPGRMVIFDDGTQPFTGRVAALLKDALQQGDVIREVTLQKLSGMGNSHPLLATHEGTGPAFFVRVRDKDLEVGGLLSLTVKGAVEVSLGTAPWTSNYSYQTNSTPPVQQFGWNGQLKVDMKVAGVARDREEIAVRAIAKQVADTMKKQVEEMRDKHGLLPELPGNFYGPYHPASVELPPGLVSTPAAVYSGLLTHNETVWNFHRAGDVTPVFQQIRTELEGAGWKVADASEGEQPYLRVTRGDATVSVFPAQSSFAMSGEQQVEAPRLYVIHYDERFSDAERNAAIESLLVPGGSADVAWIFEPMMSNEQRERLLTFPASSPSQYIRAAQIYERKKDSEAALRMLSRAQALQSVAMQTGGLDSEIREVMKKLTGKAELPELTGESLRDTGFLEVGLDAEPIVSLKRAGEAVNYYCRSQEGKLHMFSTKVQSASGAAEPTLQFVSASGGGRSYSTQSGSKNSTGKWHCDIHDSLDSFRVSGGAESSDTPGTYRFSIRIAKEPAVAAGN